MNETLRNILRELADALIFGSFFISFCAASLVLETYLLFGHKPVFDGLTFFVFFSTLALYNFHRLMGVRRIKAEDHGLITGWAAKHQFTLLMFFLIGIGGSGFFVFQLFSKTQIFFTLIPLAAISIFYELPLVKYNKQFERIRNLWMSKAFIIMAVWSITTALLPAMNIHYRLLNYNVLLVLLERLVFIFLLALSFDARDVEFDRRDNLKTIPVVYGEEQTMRLYRIFSILLFVLINVHYVVITQRWMIAIAMTLSCVLTYLAVSKSRPHKSDYYYMFIVDGMMLAQFLLIWMFSL